MVNEEAFAQAINDTCEDKEIHFKERIDECKLIVSSSDPS